MEPVTIIILFLLLGIVLWSIGTYNRFIKYANAIEEAWSGIDIQLKRRSTLVPNLIRTIERYSQHEAGIFQAKMNTDQFSSETQTRVEEESRISHSLKGLLSVAEAYPDLKASANFIELQNSLEEIEEDIQNARNRYNNYVRKYNTLRDSFPASRIAGKFGFEKQRYFAIDLATQREMPEVGFSV